MAAIWSCVNPAGMPDANIEHSHAMMSNVRKAAVAGTWYPGTAGPLASALDRHISAADRAGADVPRDLVALIPPHPGVMYSGAVAARACRLLRGRSLAGVLR